jgi:HEAT repeat protein/glycosyltransferase involved in cell wall biosynthesis
MKRLIFLTDAFGSQHGGINAFNADLCAGLARGVASGIEVVCVVTVADQQDRNDAGGKGIHLVVTGTRELTSETVIDALAKELRAPPGGEDAWWVGHDVMSGPVAAECATRAGGRLALIHHMNYSAYSAFKHAGSVDYEGRERRQRQLFEHAEALFAVGPLLSNSAAKLTGRADVHQLIPGLAADIHTIDQPRPPFRAIVFGRMGGEDDPIKQGRLAVAGFARAVGRADAQHGPDLLTTLRPEIRIFGTKASNEEMFPDLQALAERYAKGGLWPLAEPHKYTFDRAHLWSELAKAHVAIMPSWHEGFGLVGWEAIAAEVPLLVSRQSGLFLFVNQVSRIHADDLAAFNVIGRLSSDKEPFTEEDVEAVARNFTDVAAHYSTWKERAKRLKGALANYTWAATAQAFLKGLQRTERVPPPVPATSPYPGLRAFTSEEGGIFFGRSAETDAIMALLREGGQRFVAVVGASGTGKSSLIQAGVLPQLRGGAIERSEHWRTLSFAPGMTGDDPILALAVRLELLLPPQAQERPAAIAARLRQTPERLSDYLAQALGAQPGSAAVVFFIDQLEELFTLAAEQHRAPFGRLLAAAHCDPRVRLLTTLRADFLPQVMAERAVAPVFQTPGAVFPLGPPGPTALVDMIRMPAERAGLSLDEGLADEMITDAGSNPGALPLVAFCLEELYGRGRGTNRLTLENYRELGRLRGAIARRVDFVTRQFQKQDLDVALPQIFESLVHIDSTGAATRQRALRGKLAAGPDPIPEIVDTFVKERLLIAEEVGARAVLTLTHEALIEEWPALRSWLESNRAHFQRLERLLLSIASADESDRTFAIEQLPRARAIPRAVPPLLDMLLRPDPNVRASAASALGGLNLNSPEIVAALKGALRDPQEQVRGSAALALGALKEKSAVSLLIAALADPVPAVQWRAADALGDIGSADAEVVAALLTGANNADWTVRGSAIDALGALGAKTPDVVQALLSALRAPRSYVQEAAARALGTLRPETPELIPALIAALRIGSERARESAVVALEGVKASTPDAEAALMAALKDTHPRVRALAALAVVEIRPDCDKAVPALMDALAAEDKALRARAASALGNIGPAAAPAVPALIAALDGEYDIVSKRLGPWDASDR